MDLKELNNKMLLKRFREQLFFGRFEGVDFVSELLLRGMKQDMDALICMNKLLKEKNNEISKS